MSIVTEFIQNALNSATPNHHPDESCKSVFIGGLPITQIPQEENLGKALKRVNLNRGWLEQKHFNRYQVS
jgi:hypothetical protein